MVSGKQQQQVLNFASLSTRLLWSAPYTGIRVQSNKDRVRLLISLTTVLRSFERTMLENETGTLFNQCLTTVRYFFPLPHWHHSLSSPPLFGFVVPMNPFDLYFEHKSQHELWLSFIFLSCHALFLRKRANCRQLIVSRNRVVFVVYPFSISVCICRTYYVPSSDFWNT